MFLRVDDEVRARKIASTSGFQFWRAPFSQEANGRHRMKRIWIIMGPAFYLVAVSVFLLETRDKERRVIEWTEVRERVNLEPHVRAKILAEMRTMMVAVDGIVDGVARDDLRLVEQFARSAGMRGALDDDPIFRTLPESFRKLGVRTHRSFDALADQMLQGKSSD